MPDLYRRSEDPRGPQPHISMNVQGDHVAAVVTIDSHRFVLNVERNDNKGWIIYLDAPDDLLQNDYTWEIR